MCIGGAVCALLGALGRAALPGHTTQRMEGCARGGVLRRGTSVERKRRLCKLRNLWNRTFQNRIPYSSTRVEQATHLWRLRFGVVAMLLVDVHPVLFLFLTRPAELQRSLGQWVLVGANTNHPMVPTRGTYKHPIKLLHVPPPWIWDRRRHVG